MSLAPSTSRLQQRTTMNDRIRIREATSAKTDAEALAELLIDVVEGGASVGFMLPISRETAMDFWRQAQASATRGERVILIAEDRSTASVLGTVQLLLAMPENGRHRAEIAKMQVRRSARRRGVGAALLAAAEQAAREAGKTLLVLDTTTGSDAERLYTSLGWARVGDIPGYAKLPVGELCSTTVFYKQLSRLVSVRGS
jgi:GNAT superfamily N-acetyltransferase